MRKQDHKPEDHVKGSPVVASVKIHIQRVTVKHLYFLIHLFGLQAATNWCVRCRAKWTA